MTEGVNKPIFVLDLDDTIIGNIRPQLYEYIIVSHLQKQNSKYYIKQLENDLDKGLLRPFFKEFVYCLKQKKINTFIYTASSEQWAHFIIPIIEKHINYKFRRPIFTRSNMIPKHKILMKSIDKIKPVIFNSLKRLNYTVPQQPSFLKNIVMIDNRTDNIMEKRYIVHSPSYSYRVVTDITRALTIAEIKENLDVLANLGLDSRGSSINDIKDFQRRYKKKLAQYKNDSYHHNLRDKNDKYWKNVTNYLQKYNLTKLSNKKLVYELSKIK